MRQAFMTVVMACKTCPKGMNACLAQHSTSGSWRT